MKMIKTIAAAALLGAFGVSAQAAAPVFGPSYALPQYWIHADGIKPNLVKQSLSIAGCKKISLPAKGSILQGDVTLFDDNSFVLYSDWSAKGGTGPVALTGQWTQLLPNSASSKTFYLSINTASMTVLLDELQTVGLANCQTTTKPAMTSLNIIDSSVLVKKNTIVVKIKGNQAKLSLLVSGKQQNDPKGPTSPTVTGNMSMSLSMSGLFEPVP